MTLHNFTSSAVTAMITRQVKEKQTVELGKSTRSSIAPLSQTEVVEIEVRSDSRIVLMGH